MSFQAGEKIRAATFNNLVPAGDVGTYAEYQMATNITVANNTNFTVPWGTEVRASTLISRTTDGTGHRFTLNRAGLYGIAATVRWLYQAAGGERYVLIDSSDGGVASASQTDATGSSSPIGNPSAFRYFNAGSWIRIIAYQNSGGTRDLEVSSANAWGRLYLAWLHA